MDGLAIIAGIGIMVFLLLYLSLNIQNNSKIWMVLKFGIIVFALFILSYIPAVTVHLDRDCVVFANGTYSCFLSNGSQITDFNQYGNSTVNVGQGLFVNYANFLYAVMGGFFIAILWFGSIAIIEWWRGRKILK